MLEECPADVATLKGGVGRRGQRLSTEDDAGMNVAS